MINKNIIHNIKRIRHMCQFINRNNFYGSKVVVHTIIKSFIIFGNSMPWKEKQTPSGHQALRLRSKKIFIDIIGAIVEIISLRFGTITWFPSFATHDS
jgi:hypothetical protein